MFSPVRHKGFTLIEILVVLVIVGITMGLVRLNISPDQTETLKNEANRFALLLEQAGNEARASGQTLACVLSDQGYQFEKKNEKNEWGPLVDDILRPRQWPEDIRLTGLEIDGQRVALQKKTQQQRILLSSSGYNSVFVARLTLGNQNLLVSGSTTGRISVQTPPKKSK